MIKKKGLGRGLEVLLGGNTSATPEGAPSVLSVERLRPGKYQPRTRMDEGSLNELAESIRAQGVMQPLLVRPLTDGRYEIIAGERRYRAAVLAGLAEVPVLVRDVPDESAAVMALIENIQREDLNPLEEAQGVQRLIDEFGLTHEAAATAISRSRSATSNLLRLLNLAKPVQTMLMAGDLDMGHARALLATDAATQIVLANQVVARRLSVRETERMVTRVASDFNLTAGRVADGRSRRQRSGAAHGDVARLEEDLSDTLATRVAIKSGSRGKGQIVIDFSSHEQLDGIIEKLRR